VNVIVVTDHFQNYLSVFTKARGPR